MIENLNNVSEGYCYCGCGQKTRIATGNKKENGWVKGKPLQFIFGHRNRGHFSWRWNEGKTTNRYGYVFVNVPDHPRADVNGYVLEHIVIAERALGKYLSFGIEVHHVDYNKAHNENNNLVICQDRTYHRLLHRRTDALRASGNPNFLKCVFCKTWDDPTRLTFNAASGNQYHSYCLNKYQRDLRKRKREEQTNV